MINMVQVIVNIDNSALEKLSPDKMKEAQSQGMSYAAQETVRVLMQNSPVDHGLLKSWFIESMTDSEAHIRTPAEYARYVNDGTRPHIIEPKGIGLFHAGQQLTKGAALYWEGADHPVRRVHHPGIKGQHFVEKSISDVEGRLAGYFLKALEEVMG